MKSVNSTLRLLLLSVLASCVALGQSVTGTWTMLPQSDFDMIAPDGGPLHFRDRFADGAKTIPLLHRDEFTQVVGPQTTRQVIAAQAAVFGWPLTGIYISASGQQFVPHTAIHVSMLPPQTGPVGQRADRVAAAVDVALEANYKTSVTITDPTDPDFGQSFDLRSFWVVSHFWNYQTVNTNYRPKEPGGGGDFMFITSTASPPGNWWQELN